MHCLDIDCPCEALERCPTRPEEVAYETEVVVNGELTIPEVKPPSEKIISVTRKICIKNVVAVPVKLSNGCIAGCKILVVGSIRLGFEYSADVPEQEVHFVHFDVPFEALITGNPCHKPIPVGDCNLKKFKLNVCVEHLQAHQLNPRTFAKVIVLLFWLERKHCRLPGQGQDKENSGRNLKQGRQQQSDCHPHHEPGHRYDCHPHHEASHQDECDPHHESHHPDDCHPHHESHHQDECHPHHEACHQDDCHPHHKPGQRLDCRPKYEAHPQLINDWCDVTCPTSDKRPGCPVHHSCPELSKQIAINHTLEIPSHKPPAECILDSTVSINITKAEVINTPLFSEHCHKPMKKVIITGKAEIIVKYVANVPDQQVHGAAFIVPFQTLIKWPGGPPQKSPICVYATVEHFQVDLLDNRRIFKVLIIRFDVAKK